LDERTSASGRFCPFEKIEFFNSIGVKRTPQIAVAMAANDSQDIQRYCSSRRGLPWLFDPTRPESVPPKNSSRAWIEEKKLPLISQKRKLLVS
jgi:hypothetical protein